MYLRCLGRLIRQKVWQKSLDDARREVEHDLIKIVKHISLVALKPAKVSRGRIFSRVRPFNKQAVSGLGP
jgi:hypothetical protein